MTLIQLKYLTAIENHGGVTAAARALKVSQPSITMSVRQLEKEFKVKLLIRAKQAVSLSEVGKRVAAQAKIILKEADLMADVVQDYKKGLPASTRTAIVTKDREVKKVLEEQKKALEDLQDVFFNLGFGLSNLERSNGALLGGSKAQTKAQTKRNKSG